MTDPKIDHADEAREYVELTLDRPDGDGDFTAAHMLAFAQVHASLAVEAQTARLADEQRTANLIALYDMGGPDADLVPGYRAVSLQILARLDLAQDVSTDAPEMFPGAHDTLSDLANLTIRPAQETS